MFIANKLSELQQCYYFDSSNSLLTKKTGKFLKNLFSSSSPTKFMLCGLSRFHKIGATPTRTHSHTHTHIGGLLYTHIFRKFRS
jgi:hypothetical protein